MQPHAMTLTSADAWARTSVALPASAQGIPAPAYSDATCRYESYLRSFQESGALARQAVEALKKLNVPYLVSLPLVFQTTEEWLESELGVHPVQVALQARPPPACHTVAWYAVHACSCFAYCRAHPCSHSCQ